MALVTTLGEMSECWASRAARQASLDVVILPQGMYPGSHISDPATPASQACGCYMRGSRLAELTQMIPMIEKGGALARAR